MKNILIITCLIYSSYCFSQKFDENDFLNGEWCNNEKFSCFNLISEGGLLVYEIMDGGYTAGVEVLNYDDNAKKIYWRIIGTNKDTQYFEILKKNKVNHFDGQKTIVRYRSSDKKNKS